MLRLRHVRGDGSSTEGETFTVTLRDPVDGRPLTGVTVTVRVLPRTRPRELMRPYERQEPDPVTRSVVTRIDPEDVTRASDAALAEAVESWEGLVGADDAPLVCTPATIAALPDPIKIQLMHAAFGAEVVDPASFRSTAAILPVVARAGPRDTVLSASG